jgi:hypothetical protein
MARPILEDLPHGIEGWDTEHNRNAAILGDFPFPIKTYASVAALPAANTADRCIVAVNSPHGWTLAFSNGTAWQLIQGSAFGCANGQGTFFAHKSVAVGPLVGAAGTAVGVIPAGCILFGVTTRVLVEVQRAGPVLYNYDVGDGTTPDLFGLTVLGTVGNTSNLGPTPGSPGHKAGVWQPKLYTAAGDVVLTKSGVPAFLQGTVRVTAHFAVLVPPTS